MIIGAKQAHNPGGRPPKRADAIKSASVCFRLTPKQAAIVNQLTVMRTNQSCISDYLRFLIYQDLRRHGSKEMRAAFDSHSSAEHQSKSDR